MEKKYEFWQKQANEGNLSGTKDFLLDILEQEILEKYIPANSRILEIGCGDGRNAINLAKKRSATIDAFDFSEKMIESAIYNSNNEDTKVNFFIHDIKNLQKITAKYPVILSKRSLINLPDANAQMSALSKISYLLEDKGIYLMCESSLQGLNRINIMRERIGLNKIESPWHNVYIDEEKINDNTAISFGLKLSERIDFTSTYYFLSRVVNAKIANINAQDPKYDSDINKLALDLESFGNMGQTILWIWEKHK